MGFSPAAKEPIGEGCVAELIVNSASADRVRERSSDLIRAYKLWI